MQISTVLRTVPHRLLIFYGGIIKCNETLHFQERDMARPRTATKILERAGAFKQSPSRKRPKEPKGKGQFPKAAPKHLRADEKAIWRDIVKRVPDGLLTKSDVYVVEMCAVLMVQMRREGPKEMGSCLMTRLSSELKQLGLSPSARASL